MARKGMFVSWTFITLPLRTRTLSDVLNLCDCEGGGQWTGEQPKPGGVRNKEIALAISFQFYIEKQIKKILLGLFDNILYTYGASKYALKCSWLDSSKLWGRE
jgi:hypothetical protein